MRSLIITSLITFFSFHTAVSIAAESEHIIEQAHSKPTQYVLISFDGAHDNSLWQRSRDFAQRNNAQFTYFISCVFLMPRSDRRDYKPPQMQAGRSNVGFAADKNEIATRLDHIWRAQQEGHEIASHGCGHFDGKDWSQKDWAQELSEFKRIVLNSYQKNDIQDEPAEWQNFVNNQIHGFRAPYLSDGKPVQQALRDNGYLYQASGVSNSPKAPDNLNGLYSFDLAMIPEGPAQRPVIAMDYNLYIRHSKGEEQPEKSKEFEERSYQAFKNAFNKQYEGQREPLQLGFHFVLMNDGAYWRAMERLAQEVCIKEDVKCTTYSQYLADMKQNIAF